MNPIGVSDNRKANINIIKLEIILLTPTIKIYSSLASLTYTATDPVITFDSSIPKPERFKKSSNNREKCSCNAPY